MLSSSRRNVLSKCEKYNKIVNSTFKYKATEFITVKFNTSISI